MKTVFVLALLFATISAVKIECEFKMTKWWDQFGELYTCKVKSVTMTGSSSLGIVDGAHHIGKSNADVKQILFGYGEQCDLDYIPQNIHKTFPNLIGMGFYFKCRIQTLTGDELADYVKLEWFNIASNTIDKIPGSLFQSNPKMRLVSFYSNKIDKVGSSLLTGLTHLTEAHFADNICITERASNRAAVIQLIDKLKIRCPYADDPSQTTTTMATTTKATTTMDTTTTTTAATTTTTDDPTCPSTNIPVRVCRVEEVNLFQQRGIEALDQKNKDLKEEIELLKDRLEKLEAKFDF
jgi:hypothetical protein